MIELPNQLLAISSGASGYPIIIIDPVSHTIIKEIKLEGYITGYSSLCVLDFHSFIYALGEKVMQISIHDDYKILFKTNTEKQLNGYFKILLVEGGKCLMIGNNSNKGLEIIKPYYE